MTLKLIACCRFRIQGYIFSLLYMCIRFCRKKWIGGEYLDFKDVEEANKLSREFVAGSEDSPIGTGKEPELPRSYGKEKKKSRTLYW